METARRTDANSYCFFACIPVTTVQTRLDRDKGVGQSKGNHREPIQGRAGSLGSGIIVDPLFSDDCADQCRLAVSAAECEAGPDLHPDRTVCL